MPARGTELKTRIIAAAHALFSKKGYEKTSVNEIIMKLGISKGAFYHYFRSKDDVLDTIILDYVHEMVELLYGIAENSSMNALEKYRRMFLAIQEKRKQNSERFYFLVKMFLSEENLLFKQRYMEKILELTKPPFILILNQGVKEGHFKINNLEETAELIILLGNIYRTKIALLILDTHEDPNRMLKIRNLIEFTQNMIERILGLESGSLDVISRSYYSGIVT